MLSFACLADSEMIPKASARKRIEMSLNPGLMDLEQELINIRSKRLKEKKPKAQPKKLQGRQEVPEVFFKSSESSGSFER